MSKSVQGKRIENELRSVNSKMASLKQYKAELNLYNGQEKIFKKDIDILKYKISMVECNLELVKTSLELLDTTERVIIAEYYFAKKTKNNIGYQLNISINTVSVYKKIALEKLGDLLYDHFAFWDKKGYKFPLEENKKVKLIFQYDLEGNFIKKWNSSKECSIDTEFNSSCISDCCRGRGKTYKGYKWSYVPLQVNRNI